MYRLALFPLLLALTAPTPISIHVDKTVLMAGATLTVMCRAPKSPDNRNIAAVVMNYRSSEESMDGERARQFYQFVFPRVPCGSEQVMCVLTDRYWQVFSAVQRIEVGGCEGY